MFCWNVRTVAVAIYFCLFVGALWQGTVQAAPTPQPASGVGKPTKPTGLMAGPLERHIAHHTVTLRQCPPFDAAQLAELQSALTVGSKTFAERVESAAQQTLRPDVEPPFVLIDEYVRVPDGEMVEAPHSFALLVDYGVKIESMQFHFTTQGCESTDRAGEAWRNKQAADYEKTRALGDRVSIAIKKWECPALNDGEATWLYSSAIDNENVLQAMMALAIQGHTRVTANPHFGHYHTGVPNERGYQDTMPSVSAPETVAFTIVDLDTKNYVQFWIHPGGCKVVTKGSLGPPK